MSRRLTTRLGALARDTHAATLVEFAIIAPVVCMLLLGAFDIGHTLYMRSVLQGVVQKTARDSTLETGTEADVQATLDNNVRAQVSALANNATITFSRRYYRDYATASAAQPEAWTDTDHDGTCDHGEPFQDANQNGVWDKDGANGGQGGAEDATVYTVTVTYPRMFPAAKFIGGSSTTTISATTVLRNQPYSDQGSYGTPVVLNCP
jgi:Flp pilus assembly protein TadG